MELRTTPATYMASVSWQYLQDQLIALRRQNSQAEAAQPVSNGIDLARVNFRYEVAGNRAPWRPLRTFDDGKQMTPWHAASELLRLGSEAEVLEQIVLREKMAEMTRAMADRYAA